MGIQFKPGLLQIRPQYETDPDAPSHPENILWLLSSTTVPSPTLFQLQGIQSAFDSAWATFMSHWLPTERRYPGSVITDFSSAFGLSNDSRGVFAPVVGLSGDELPPQVAGLLSWASTMRYRGGHFRTYLPYASNAHVQGPFVDTIQPGSITTMNGDINTLRTNMAASGILGGQNFVLYRKRLDPVLAQLIPTTTVKVQPLIATQRRRVRKASHH
jgi:hypothetical protein